MPNQPVALASMRPKILTPIFGGGDLRSNGVSYQQKKLI
jgi:hypothetical protein